MVSLCFYSEKGHHSFSELAVIWDMKPWFAVSCRGQRCIQNKCKQDLEKIYWFRKWLFLDLDTIYLLSFCNIQPHIMQNTEDQENKREKKVSKSWMKFLSLFFTSKYNVYKKERLQGQIVIRSWFKGFLTRGGSLSPSLSFKRRNLNNWTVNL